MSKGLKIYKAKLVSTGLEVNLENFNESDRYNLVCEDCDAKLKYTKGHWRNKNKTWEMNEQIFYKNGINFDFRLHILAKAIKEEKRKGATSRDNYSSLIRKSSNKKLSSYLKSAKGIAKLWNAIQTNEDKELLKTKVKIVLGRESISWKDFVFENNDFGTLVSKIPKYPVSLILQTKKFDKPSKNRSLVNCIQCYSASYNEKIIIPRIYFNDHIFKENQQYLVSLSKHQFLPS